MKEWATVAIGKTKTQFIDGDRSKRYPKRSEYVDDGVMFLNAEAINTGVIRKDRVNYVSESKYAEIKKGRIRRDDILLTTRGNGIGDAAFVNIDDRGLTNAQMLILRSDPNELCPRFLYYYFATDTLRAYIHNFASGSAQPQLPIRDLKKIPVSFPDIETQRSIAGVLSAYDDLVALNQQRITLLESLAEELYREWFVRFRFDGYRQTAFEKGIPKDWSQYCFREIVEFYIGGGWGEDEVSSNFSDPGFVIRGTDIAKIGNGNLSEIPFRYHKPSNLKKRRLQPYDFVFEVAGGSKGQLLGRNLMVSEEIIQYLGSPVMCASFCKQIRFNQSVVSPLFMKYYLKLFHRCGLAGIFQVQSTGISNYQFESFLNFQKLHIPLLSLQRQFEDFVRPIIEKQDCLLLANINLRETQKLLSKRLLSGKLSVNEITESAGAGFNSELVHA